MLSCRECAKFLSKNFPCTSCLVRPTCAIGHFTTIEPKKPCTPYSEWIIVANENLQNQNREDSLKTFQIMWEYIQEEFTKI